MPRQRLRPTRRQSASQRPPAPGSSTERAAAKTAQPVRTGPKPKPAWRETIDSFGGFVTIGAIAAAIVVVVAIFITQRPDSTSVEVSDAPLMGEPISDATLAEPGQGHVSDPNELVIPPGEPPTGGPHFAVAQDVGFYDQPVPDGNTIHALEHGVIWISYNPELVDEQTVAALEELWEDYGNDVIVAPRPENSMAIAAASWGRLLSLDSFDREQLEQFIETNRNRSPEPGVRTNRPM